MYIPPWGRASHLSPQGHVSINEGDDLELNGKDEIPYVLVENLGHGASAIVEKVRDVNNGNIYARKIFKNTSSRKLAESKKAFKNEVKVIRRLKSHHHMIRVFATYMVQRELALILTPVADTGDLAAFLQLYRDTDLSAPSQIDMRITLRNAFGCLVAGLAFIHKQTIRHKDIKPQNILIHRGSVLYTDFGISLDFSEHGNSTTTGRPESFTRRYCAPEVVNWDRRNSKSDVFSLGCVYVEILDALYPKLLPEALLKGPFHETHGLFWLADYFMGDWIPDHVINEVMWSISNMVSFGVEERMSASEIWDQLRCARAVRTLSCEACISDIDLGHSNDRSNGT
jgi:serine/threonine protein kinase